jgi:hypothetical protein
MSVETLKFRGEPLKALSDAAQEKIMRIKFPKISRRELGGAGVIAVGAGGAVDAVKLVVGAFDPSTARPVDATANGFDPSSARPVNASAQPAASRFDPSTAKPVTD